MARTKQQLFGLLSGVVLSGLSTASAAQATRTWVSATGDDVSPCSRTSPCKTFAGALLKTAVDGEINCLDPGGFGPVVIKKPVAIICDQFDAGVATGGFNGVVVELSKGDDNVFLSGLDILGSSVGRPHEGSSGIRFTGPGVLVIRNSTIRMFRGGAGISFQPSGKASLLISNSTISSNRTGIAAIGDKAGQVVVDDSLIFANDTGVKASGGVTIISAGNNVLAGNVSDGQFSLTKARQ